MHELPWITILGHEWGDLPIISTSDEVASENSWQIASRVIQKSLLTVTNVLRFSYTLFFGPEYTILLVDFAIVATDGLSWLSIVASPQLICDVMWTQVTAIVTSYSPIALARTNWHKSFLH